MSQTTEMEQPDSTLMTRLQDGDMDALGVLYSRYARMVKAAISRTIPKGEAEDHEELLQEVFLTLSATANRYEEKLRLKAWLYSIAVRKSLNFKRTTSLRTHLFGKLKNDERILNQNSVTTPLRALETQEAVEHILSKLSRGQRDVMVLRIFEGFTGAEISKILGISPTTVDNRMHRARKLLVEELGQPKKPITNGNVKI